LTARSTHLNVSLPSGSLSLDRVRIMGILNTTPDSFYDGGSYVDVDRALARAFTMVEEGADILDIGGEKAGPGDAVCVEEELRRVIPAIEAIRREMRTPISVDTRRPQVARSAMDAGADIINSITGFVDAELRAVAARTRAAIVIMHIKGEPRVANPSPSYLDVMGEVRQFIEARVADCLSEGVHPGGIIVDPGPGFGKTTRHDLVVLRDLHQLTSLPYPVLLAVSRKKFIGEVLDLPTAERLPGSLACVVWGVLHGAKLVRVHDVRATCRVCTMVEAVLDPAWEPIG